MGWPCDACQSFPDHFRNELSVSGQIISNGLGGSTDWLVGGQLQPSLRDLALARLLTQHWRAGLCSSVPAGLGFLAHQATGFTSVPSPATSMVMVSPDLSQRWGLRPRPTPAGVPVLMISPGRSGVMEEM